jgi:hypothetical protein
MTCRRGGRPATAAGHLLCGVGLGVALPMASFLLANRLWGLTGAVGGAVGWTTVCQLVRKMAGRPASKLLALGLSETAVRSSVAVAFHSARLYFVVPALLTTASGFAYGWLGLRRPCWFESLVAEVVPRQFLNRFDTRLQPFITAAALIYGAEQVVVGSLSFALALMLPPSTYVVVHPLVSWSLFGLTALAALTLMHNNISQTRCCAG